MPWLMDIQGVLNFPELKKKGVVGRKKGWGRDCEERMEVGKRGNFQQTREIKTKKFKKVIFSINTEMK